MSSSAPVFSERHWRGSAQQLATRVNLGWWWHEFSPALVGINLGGATGLLMFRHMRWPVALWAGLLIGLLAMAALWAWRRARPHFYSVNEGLLRLETHLVWHNVFSTATLGMAAWPGPSPQSVRALRWQWGPSLRPALGSILLLLLGGILPVGSPTRAPLPDPSQMPTAVQQVDSWMATLKDQDLVEKTMLDSWQERLDQLKLKPKNEWFSQESLEADEALRNQMAQEMDSLNKNLQKASGLMGNMEKLPSAASDTSGDLNAQMAQTLSNLQNGGLPLRYDYSNALANYQQLSPEQKAQLQQQMLSGSNALGNCTGSVMGNGQGQGQGQGQGMGSMNGLGQWSQNITTGSGGKGGGGPAPLVYSSQATDLEASKREGVTNSNMKAPVIGETLAITPGGAPKVPESDDTSTAGGAADVGNGGDAVWRQELTPQEREVLQKYFK